MTLVIGVANRDPEHFPAADRFDVARQQNDHLAFGWGVHFCLGAPLARLEAQIALRSVLDRFPDMRQEGGEIVWLENMSMRRPDRLPVRF